MSTSNRSPHVSGGSLHRADSGVRRLLVGMALFVIAWADTHAVQPAQKGVLVLYSTRRDAQLSVIGDRELPQILQEGLPEGLDFYSEYIDLARSADPEYLNKFRDFIRVKYDDVRLDVIIAMQDTALAFVNRYRTELFPDTPVVFLSTNTAAPTVRNGTGL